MGWYKLVSEFIENRKRSGTWLAKESRWSRQNVISWSKGGDAGLRKVYRAVLVMARDEKKTPEAKWEELRIALAEEHAVLEGDDVA